MVPLSDVTPGPLPLDILSILEQRCLRRGDFCNLHALEHAIAVFIDTYNRRHARLFRWTYTGDPLIE